MTNKPSNASSERLSDLVAALRIGVPGDQITLFGILVSLIAVFGVSVQGFASLSTAQSITYQVPLLCVLTLAMFAPLMTGGLNLAIIATSNSCALLMTWIFVTLSSQASMSPAIVILAGLLVGLVYCIIVGIVTGALIAYTGVHPIMITLGTQSIMYGASLFFTRGQIMSGVPSLYTDIANYAVLGLPVTFLFMIFLVIVVALVMEKTPFGVACAMVGSNAEATNFSAISVHRVLIVTYLLSSVLCFAAAAIMLAIFNSAGTTYAQSYLLITILAAVLGGVDPFGGSGKVAGLILAIAILQVIASGFNQMGLSPQLTSAIWGGILVAAMLIQNVRMRNHRRTG